MEKNLDMGGLERAFNRLGSKKVSTPSIKSESEVGTSANSTEKPETYKIANFAEELKDKANFNGMDLVFVLDTTASMGPYIEGAKESIRQIIQDAKQSLIELEQPEDSLKFAMVCYRDHPPEDSTYITLICDFTDAETCLKFLDKVTAQGGGDGSEAVLDGLNDAIYKTAWRENSEKYLFLVLDWPPHGLRFNSTSDNFPNGCPCGYHEKELMPKLREMKVDFTIIKIAEYINTMIDLFSQFINIDVHAPKIFQQKNTSTYSGTEGSKAYTEGVKYEMSKNCKGKVMKSMGEYVENKKSKK